MAITYKIIGGDQKEYGMVSAEDMRKWIAEGRLNVQTLAKAEGNEEFRPLGGFPEFVAALAAAAVEPPPPPASVAPSNPLERDYDLDIGGCISGGWTLLKNNFGLLFVGVLIYFLIEGTIAGLGLIPIIGPLFSIANLFITGPLLGGVFYIFIRAIRGQPAEIGDVFAGFRKAFLQLFLGYLVPALLAGVCLIPVGIVAFFSVFPALAHHQPLPPPESVFLKLVPVLLICLIPTVYLQISWSFTLPLIIDKQMDFWPAMKTSWKMVNKHWWLVFGLVVLVGLLNVVGVLLCCIGVLFTAPIGLGALMYAYETIFSSAGAQTG